MEKQNHTSYLSGTSEAEILTGLCQLSTLQELCGFCETRLPSLCDMQKVTAALKKHKPLINKNRYLTLSFSPEPEKKIFICFIKNVPLHISEIKFLKRIIKLIQAKTDKIRHQLLMEKTKRQWNFIFKHIPIPLCVCTRLGMIHMANPAFLKGTGRSFSEVRQKQMFLAGFRDHLSACSLREPQIIKKTKRIKGKPNHFECNIRPITPFLFLCSIRDMTNHHKMEQSLGESSQTRELGIISSSIAHELRNPLAGILALLQTMLLDKNNASIRTDLKEMQKASLKCSHLTTQLLNQGG